MTSIAHVHRDAQLLLRAEALLEDHHRPVPERRISSCVPWCIAHRHTDLHRRKRCVSRPSPFDTGMAGGWFCALAAIGVETIAMERSKVRVLRIPAVQQPMCRRDTRIHGRLWRQIVTARELASAACTRRCRAGAATTQPLSLTSRASLRRVRVAGAHVVARDPDARPKRLAIGVERRSRGDEGVPARRLVPATAAIEPVEQRRMTFDVAARDASAAGVDPGLATRAHARRAGARALDRAARLHVYRVDEKDAARRAQQQERADHGAEAAPHQKVPETESAPPPGSADALTVDRGAAETRCGMKKIETALTSATPSEMVLIHAWVSARPAASVDC